LGAQGYSGGRLGLEGESLTREELRAICDTYRTKEQILAALRVSSP